MQPFTTAVPPELEAAAREEIVRTVNAYIAETGASLRRACSDLGYSITTVSRWFRAYAEKGVAGLMPDYSKCGRKPKFELNDEEAAVLRDLRLRRGSLALAVEEFPQSRICRAQTRDSIFAELDAAAREGRMPRWPRSLRRAGYVTVEEEQQFRGPKHFQSVEFQDRRDMTIVLPNGQRVPLGPNMLRESDDMSLNEPFRYHDPEAGLNMGRQTLCSMDVYAAAWLGGSPIGRERDAYRAEDIADHIASICEVHGLPMIWRFERGPWECDFIDGVKLADGTRWGGLNGLFHVQHVFKSKGKGLIESSFNLLQKLMAHESTSIGRSRGEFEQATKDWLKAGRGNPESVGKFWDIAAAADGLAAAMERFNHRPKQRRAHGSGVVVPADLFRDAPIRPVPANEAWRLLPIKKQCTVRQGHIDTVAPHYPLPFRFRVNGETELYLEHGYQVLIAFHPGRPDEGAWIFNGETGPRNRAGLKLGEFLCIAPMALDAPQVNLAPGEREHVVRKNANAAVRSEFRGITQAGKANRSTGTARTSFGERAETIRGSAVESKRIPMDAVLETPPPRITFPKIAPKADTTDAELADLEAEERALMAEAGII